jgi:hypothetical protein
MSDLEAAFKDMRSRDRVEVTRTVNVIDQRTGRILGQLVNFSEQGIMVMSMDALEENCVFQVTLVLGESTSSTSIEIGVESLWSHSNSDHTQFWTGFYIIDISQESAELLHNLLGLKA